jgi:hypothetical protein
MASDNRFNFKDGFCSVSGKLANSYHLDTFMDDGTEINGPWLLETDGFIDFYDMDQRLRLNDSLKIGRNKQPKSVFDSKFNECVDIIHRLFHYNSIEHNSNDCASVEEMLKYTNKVYTYKDIYGTEYWFYFYKTACKDNDIVVKDSLAIEIANSHVYISFYDKELIPMYIESIKNEEVDKSLLIDRFNGVVNSIREKYGIKEDIR